jgi:AcrR family transcriptional regulator
LTDSASLAWREQILKAARAAIEEHGPDALTSQIADRAGLARPNVYRHFDSKDDLDLAVARNAYQELRAQIRSRLDLCGSPLDVIRAPIAVQVIWANSHPNLYRFLLRHGHQRRARQRNVTFTAELAAAGARYFPHFADTPELADNIIIGLGAMIDASTVTWLARPSETRDQLIDRLTTHVWLIIDHHLRRAGISLDPAVPLPQTGTRQAQTTDPQTGDHPQPTHQQHQNQPHKPAQQQNSTHPQKVIATSHRKIRANQIRMPRSAQGAQ